MKYKDNMLSKRAAKPGKNHKAAVMEIGRVSFI